MLIEAPAGLEGVVAARTRISGVDGEKGELILAGYPVEEIAPQAAFEELVWLLWNGDRPGSDELAAFRAELAGLRALPAATMALVREATLAGASSMDTLRMAAGTLDLGSTASDDWSAALALTARFPTIVAAHYRYTQGQEPLAPRTDLSHAANYLYMLFGTEPAAETVRALETYLNTVVDHGLNASTFAARVIIATGSDLTSAITGAVGALKGPLHGGAPGPALDMVFEIGSADRAEEVLRAKLSAGERLMGFGHRVYRVRDPRADVLAAAAGRLFSTEGDRELYALALEVEQTALRLLEEYKPGRRLQTNVEFYTALLLHGIGLPTELFTPTFAVSRVAGWIAHCMEQRGVGRIYRPQSVYTGPLGLRWSADEQVGVTAGA